MPRGAQDVSYISFNNGFVTERTPLNEEKGLLTDIDNCDIEPRGSVRRRLGLNEEPGGSALLAGKHTPSWYEDFIAEEGLQGGPFAIEIDGAPLSITTAADLAVTVHEWPAPGGRADLNFIVIQSGTWLAVRNWDSETITDVASIENLLDFGEGTEINIARKDSGVVWKSRVDDAAKTPLRSANGLGRIWFASPAIIPFYLNFDPNTEELSARPVGYDDQRYTAGKLHIRHFGDLPTNIRTEEQPVFLFDGSPLSPIETTFGEGNRHWYNLINRGWKTDLINDYFDSQGKYPSRAQQWVLGKNSTDDFDPELLTKQDFGNGSAPTGRVIINILERDYSSVRANLTGNETEFGDGFFDRIQEALSGEEETEDEVVRIVANSEDEPATSSFRAVEFFSGRLWLAGETNPVTSPSVYFSKTIRSVEDAGVFLQEQDPTSEHFSDLLDTDGGVIPIPDADTIIALRAFGAGVLVMATNGVWYIYGGQQNFTASTYSVEKISSTGCLSGDSIVDTDQAVYYFAENGVHALALPEQGVVPVLTDISRERIFTFYNKIPLKARENSQGSFDRVSKKIFWSYLESDEVNPNYGSIYNRMLILDTRTGAFSKHSFTIDQDNVQGNGAVFPKITRTKPIVEEAVTVDNEIVTDGDGNVVFTFEEANVIDDFVSSVKVIYIDGVAGELRVMEFDDNLFEDYRDLSLPTDTYTSYLDTHYEVLEDLQRSKKATYIHSFFQRTESGFLQDGEGNIVAENESACTLQGRWDWHNSAAGNRWTKKQNAYRYRRPYTPTSLADDFDTGEKVVYTKLKIRGQGRSLLLHYESEPKKNFHLLGYAASMTADGA